MADDHKAKAWALQRVSAEAQVLTRFRRRTPYFEFGNRPRRIAGSGGGAHANVPCRTRWKRHDEAQMLGIGHRRENHALEHRTAPCCGARLAVLGRIERTRASKQPPVRSKVVDDGTDRPDVAEIDRECLTLVPQRALPQ